MSNSNNDVITTKECDYLEQDPEIRGQRYCCVSFLDPTEILKQKEMFTIEKYLEKFSDTVNKVFDDLVQNNPEFAKSSRIVKDAYASIFDPNEIVNDYKFFCGENASTINSEFGEQVGFQTSTRGFKIRGVFDNIQEANARCEKLRVIDSNKHNIFVAEVGCWCPWNPDPNLMDNQEFAETELNTLMYKYRENIENKNKHYEERKKMLEQEIKEENTSRKLNNESIKESLDSQEDPWISSKKKL